MGGTQFKCNCDVNEEGPHVDGGVIIKKDRVPVCQVGLWTKGFVLFVFVLFFCLFFVCFFEQVGGGGRMATTVTSENVPGVESLIKKDPKMTYAEIQDIMKISLGSLICILHDCLGIRKRCARFVHHNLSEEQKRGRVVCLLVGC